MDLATNKLYFDNLFEGLYCVDTSRTITYWNKAAELITGYTAAEVIGSKCYDNLLKHVDEAGTQLCLGYCPLTKTMQDGQIREIRVFLQHKGGHRLPVDVRSLPLLDDKGFITGTMEIFRTTERAIRPEILKELARRAFLDPVTGVPNREYINGKIKSLLSQSANYENKWLGTLFISIDNIDEISQTHGVAAADEALKIAAATITNNLQEGDLLARWDGGIFLTIINTTKKSMLLNWAAKLKALVTQSTVRNYEDISLDVYVGGLIFKSDEPDLLYRALNEELKNAQISLNGISIKE